MRLRWCRLETQASQAGQLFNYDQVENLDQNWLQWWRLGKPNPTIYKVLGSRLWWWRRLGVGKPGQLNPAQAWLASSCLFNYSKWFLMFLILNHNDDDEDWETRPAQARLASSCLFNYSKLQLQLPCNFLQPFRNDDLDANTKIHENRNKKIHGQYKNTKN